MTDATQRHAIDELSREPIDEPSRLRAFALLEEAEEALDQGQAERALDLLDEALGLLPAEPRVQARRALAMARVGRPFDEARSLCEAAAQRAFDDPAPYVDLARLYLGVGRRSEALRYLRRACMIDPDHPLATRLLDALGLRGAPMISTLPRRHPVNRALGALRNRLRRLLIPTMRNDMSRTTNARDPLHR